MGCQKEIAKEIKEADAEYVLALKGNQGQCYEEIKSYLDDAVARHHEKAPAKRNARAAWPIKRRWKKITGVWKRGATGRAESWTGLRAKESGKACAAWAWWRACGKWARPRPPVERRYYLSSLGVDVEKFARAVRGHWAIENSLHWVLDVQCGEDRSRARVGHAAVNLATLRRLALNLLKQDRTKKRGIKGKQLNASWDHRYLLRLLAF